MFDVAGNLDAFGRQLCGLAHRSGNNVNALGEALDHALGDGKGVLRGRGHAAKEHMVPGVVVKRRDFEPRRQRGTKLRQRLGQTQEDQAVDSNEAELFACIAADGLVQAADARGATVEARLDKGRGAVATVLVQQGTLRIGDAIVAGTSYGRVRAMLDENGNHMKEATPSTPVQVLGLTSVPTAGDLFLVASDDRTARQIAEKRQATERAAQLAKRRKIVSLESLKEQFAKSEVDMLNIVIKGDSSGSVEALEDSLMKIEVSDEVGIQVIHRGVGAITQNDVNLATVDKAVIIGFNVRPNRQVADLADREGVEIKYYSIIYKAIEDIEAALKGMLKPEYEEVVTSHSEIREIFRSSKFGNIAGVMVQDGEVKRGTKCRILRNGVATVNDLEISSLRRFKDDVQSVKEGYEAGINLGTFNDIELGDIIETFEMQEVERK